MTNRETFDKWKFDNLRTDSITYYRDVALAKSSWQACEADHAAYVTKLESALNEITLLRSSTMNYGVARYIANKALGETK